MYVCLHKVAVPGTCLTLLSIPNLPSTVFLVRRSDQLAAAGDFITYMRFLKLMLVYLSHFGTPLYKVFSTSIQRIALR